MQKDTRDTIKQQALDEITFARNAKSGVLAEWRRNEIVLKKMVGDSERSNIDLGEGASFVNTFLSKINSPFNFRFAKGSEADMQAAKITNAIKEKDAKSGRWNYKAMLARTELIQYGRYIFEYHADSVNGYQSHLTNVSVYQFLIDPSCGGIDIEKAFYMGRGGIIKTRTQLEEGRTKGTYLRTETNNLLNSASNAQAETPEERDAKNRWIQLAPTNLIERKDQWIFWEWYTTYKGERFYVLLTENGNEAVRIEKLTEIFETGIYPFFTVAAYPEIGQFWTTAPLATVREAITAKATAINQTLDNGEAINKPMKAFDVGVIKNPALLKFRKDGLIPVKEGTDIAKAVQFFPVIPLTTSIIVYDKLDDIVSTQSGVTNSARGSATEDKVGIYEGNQANAADRFSLVEVSEADGQYRFAELYLAGLDEHMTKKVAVEMVGIDGVEYIDVTAKELKRKSNFSIAIVTAGTEETMQTTERRNKLTFLASKSQDQNYNPKVLGEMEATIAGFNIDEVKRMLDTKDVSNAELMGMAAKDIEMIIQGKQVEPNQSANTSYQQKVLDYVRKEFNNLKPPVIDALFAYIDALTPIVFRNMQTSINDTLAQEGIPTMPGQEAGLIGQAQVPGQPEVPEQLEPLLNNQQ